MTASPRVLTAILALLALAGCDPEAADQRATARATTAQAAVEPVLAAPIRGLFGQAGKGPGAFTVPRAVAASSEALFILDRTGRIQKLDRAGRSLATASIPDASRGTPTGICLGPGGLLYIADSHQNRVLKYDRDLTFLGSFGVAGREAGSFLLLTDIDSDGERLAVTDHGDDVARVQLFDGDGGLIRSIGTYGSGPGQLRRPMGVAIDAARKRLLVADAENHRVAFFGLDGAFLGALGRLGEERGEFVYPYALALGSGGEFYVAEFGAHRVQRFAADGRWLGAFGGPGRGPGQLNFPWDLTCEGAELIVLDSRNHRVYRLDPGLPGRG